MKDLLELLSKVNPEADVIIHRDCQNYGYGIIDRIVIGVFETTDYGNDFLPEQRIIISPSQVKAVCIYPEDSEQPEVQEDTRKH